MQGCHTYLLHFKSTSFKLKTSQRNNFQIIKVIVTSLCQNQIEFENEF